MKKIKELIIKYRELITYVVFGVLTTLVNWAVYTVLILALPDGMAESAKLTLSNAVAWVAGVLFAFITNKIWVFESKSFKPVILLKEFISFVAARAATGVLEIFGVPLLVKIGLNQTLFGVDGAIAKAVVSVAVVILNYVFSKLIVFRKKKDK